MKRTAYEVEHPDSRTASSTAAFFDDAHAQAVTRLQSRFMARTEWPTWAVLFAVYGLWIGTLFLLHRGTIGLPGATPLLIVACTWYMSLQHELLHGHPTRWPLFNKALGYAPLAVWYPYTLYRDSHMRHHRDADLTVPNLDPETNYVDAPRWEAMPAVMRQLWRAQRTFVGRLVIGPPLAVGRTYKSALAELARGQWHYAPMWGAHAVLSLALMAGIQHWTGMPAWYYLLFISWPALSLAMIRSFYEHRAAEKVSERTAINEAGRVMRLLYLNNNYHSVHHDLPGLPWYLLGATYRLRSHDYVVKNGGFHIAGGYRALFARYALRAPDGSVHPSAR